MTQEPRYRLGIDIGGTFTDFVLLDEESGEMHLNKCLTTPHNPAEGVMEGLEGLFANLGINGQDISTVIHATTLVSNALIERKGAKTALLATDGFRDVLEMGTEVRYDIYDLFLKRPEPLVPRRLRFDIPERLGPDGSVLTPLDRSSVEKITRQLGLAGVESIAICFLHAFRNMAHEQAARDIIQRLLPDTAVSISAEVAPEIREYERMSTTVANAYVQPIIHDYVDVLEDRLKKKGVSRRLFLMLSSGGVTTTSTAKTFPIRLAESGPAAGVLAASYLSRWADVNSFVSFDMGGTTAKIGVVRDGKPSMAGMMEVAREHRFKKGSGIPVKIPVIELIEIGAGGGSIAYKDKLGLLKVGPESAGADPGPVCYSRGGEEPTVTDANVILGYLSADNFLGGTMPLDVEGARHIIRDRLAKPLALSVTEAAAGIYEVVNQNMLSAMKVHIAERGEDPRRFYLFAFGGAGPAHAYELARMLGMKGVVIPPGAGATSALGLVTTAASFEYARSYVTRLDQVDWEDLQAVFEAMEIEGRNVLQQDSNDHSDPYIEVIRSLDLRHKGQGYELNVPIPDEVFEQGSTDALKALFYANYKNKYGHAHTHLPVELITCRCVVRGPQPDVSLQQQAIASTTAAQKGERPVYFPELGDYVDTPVYERYQLGVNASIEGPAILEERECTIVAGPASMVSVDPYANLIINIRQEA